MSISKQVANLQKAKTMKSPQFGLPLLLVAALLMLLSLTTSVSAFPGLNSTTTYGAWDPFQKLAGCHMGDQLPGLSSLKQYLHRFGYLPDPPPTNFSDDFDEAMEAAIKTYQTNFNLNASGILDNSTVSFMVRPRCGVPDVVNGTSTMNSGRRSSQLRGHSVAHFSFFPGRPTWPPFKRQLTYAFLPTSAQISDSQLLSSIFSRAFARWSEVTTLTFQETSFSQLADIRIGFYSGDHGDGEAFDGVLGTLAHAFSPPDGRFHLDADENWNVDSGSVGLGEIDLESVAVHEIGHLLGLGHSSVQEAIMYPTITSGLRRVQLGSDDVEGIQRLYGSNPSYNGSTDSPAVPSTQERDSSGADCWSRRGVGMALTLSLVFAAGFLRACE